jgi:L-lactate dehydrogenase complex protein LldG
MSSREIILNKLRAAKRPFPDAPARPKSYLPVTEVDDQTPDGLLQRFTEVMEALRGNVHPVEGDAGARAKILDLLREHKADHILAWDYQYIPVDGMENALREAGVRVTFPDLLHTENRPEHGALLKSAGAGLIGVDAVAASTASLILSTKPGRGRVASVLPPVLIAAVTLDQIVPRIESWLARERANGLETIKNSANLCFISGPSRTGDIEMQLVLGVHGPGIVHVVVKK